MLRSKWRWLAGLLAGSLLAGAPAAAAGDEVVKLTHQGVERSALVHRPESSVERPQPLIVVLHGNGDSAVNFKSWAGFAPVVEREGIVAVYPDAIDGRWSYGRAIVGPMPNAGDATADDVGFIDLLIKRLIDRGVADSSRVYIAGASRGGLMTFSLVCALGDRIAAAASLITGMTEYQVEDCKPSRSVPMVLIAGSNDNVQVYDGWLAPLGRLLSVPETLEFWRKLAGCTGQTGKMLPPLNADDRTRVGVMDWTGCKSGTALRYYKVIGGGHQIPSLSSRASPMSVQKFGQRNRDIESAEEVWSFVRQYSLAAR